MQTVVIMCMECGKIFRKATGKYTYEVKCPYCHSFDTEPIYTVSPKS